MSQKVFIDSDVILDVLIAREPHAIFSAEILSFCENKTLQGFTSSIAILNTAYVLGKSNLAQIKPYIESIRTIIKVLPTTDKDIEYGLNSHFKDFEDSVQSSVALNKKLDYIITRNTKDYANSEVKAISPEHFLKKYYA